MFVSRSADTHVSIAALWVQENAAAARTRTASRDAVREVIRAPVPGLQSLGLSRQRLPGIAAAKRTASGTPPLDCHHPIRIRCALTHRVGGRPAIHDTDAVTGIDWLHSVPVAADIACFEGHRS